MVFMDKIGILVTIIYKLNEETTQKEVFRRKNTFIRYYFRFISHNLQTPNLSFPSLTFLYNSKTLITFAYEVYLLNFSPKKTIQ